jgi:hypothetical protein
MVDSHPRLGVHYASEIRSEALPQSLLPSQVQPAGFRGQG